MPEEQRGIIAEFILRHEEMERANQAAAQGLDNLAMMNAGMPAAAMGRKMEQMSQEGKEVT